MDDMTDFDPQALAQLQHFAEPIADQAPDQAPDQPAPVADTHAASPLAELLARLEALEAHARRNGWSL